MKKILISLFSIGVVAVVAVYAANAFFSDTEESVGNTLVAGAIDLKVDNTCYYNGEACTQGTWGDGGEDCDCTWGPEDLTNEHLFFDISDIKPGDYEEDTISLAVKFNEAWLCADVHLTSDRDEDCTDPEDEAEGPNVCGSGDPDTNGDLADEIRFLWWADDGDNVLEEGERTLPSGPLGFLNVSQTSTVALADSQTNIWGPPGPIPAGGETLYLGKAWCFGSISPAPLTPGVYPDGPAGDNDQSAPAGTPEDGGFNCDGESVDNAAQTDSLTVDIAFRAEQARHNDGFVCRTPEVTVTPTVTPTPTEIPSPTPTG